MAVVTSPCEPGGKVRVRRPRLNSALGCAGSPATAARTLARTMAWRKRGTGSVAVPLETRSELSASRVTLALMGAAGRGGVDLTGVVGAGLTGRVVATGRFLAGVGLGLGAAGGAAAGTGAGAGAGVSRTVVHPPERSASSMIARGALPFMVGSISCDAMLENVAKMRGGRLMAGLVLVAGLAGCDLLTVSQTGRHIREGNEAVLRGEFQKAVQHYESALDGTMLSAEAHYRLGLVYEDQLKNQTGALHHFERYLELAPQGQFATDVKGYVDRLRLVIVSSLAEGTVLPAREASRLKNENLELRQQLAELRDKQPAGRAAAVPAPTPQSVATPRLVVAATPPPLPPEETPEPEVRRAIPVTPTAVAAATPAAPAAAPTGPRSHTVVSGDTLAKMARTYYGNSGQWPKILEANKGTLEDPTKLKIGMVLVIPE